MVLVVPQVPSLLYKIPFSSLKKKIKSYEWKLSNPKLTTGAMRRTGTTDGYNHTRGS